MQLLYQGAEARLFLDSSQKQVVKQRFRKTYRHPSLDERLTQRRVQQEARCLVRALKAGVSVPSVYAVYLPLNALWLEWIEGEPVRVVLERLTSLDNWQNKGQSFLDRLSACLGEALAKLHDASLIHGDLTTSNMLLRGPKIESFTNSNLDLVMIDFGLSHVSTLEEDKAVDLYVLERAVDSTHSVLGNWFSSVLTYYNQFSAKGARVLKRLDDVRARGRKRSMIG